MEKHTDCSLKESLPSKTMPDANAPQTLKTPLRILQHSSRNIPIRRKRNILQALQPAISLLLLQIQIIAYSITSRVRTLVAIDRLTAVIQRAGINTIREGIHVDAADFVEGLDHVLAAAEGEGGAGGGGEEGGGQVQAFGEGFNGEGGVGGGLTWGGGGGGSEVEGAGGGGAGVCEGGLGLEASWG